MSRTPDKPFLTWEQQLNRIKEVHRINFKDEASALLDLKICSYYDLINGYKNFVENNRGSESSTSLALLFRTYRQERLFRGTLITYTCLIESTFKNLLAYVISKDMGVFQDEYLDINKYKRNKKNKQQGEKLQKTINDLWDLCTQEDGEPTNHYRRTKNHIPPWILFKNSTFSDATTLFQNLRSDQKMQIIANYPFFSFENSQAIDAFTSAINYVRKYRNLAVHNLNFVQYDKKYLNAKIFQELEERLVTPSQTKNKRNSVLAYILALFSLLSIDPVLAPIFISSIAVHCKHLDPLYLEIAGIQQENLDFFNSYANTTP